jgi:hypothetical protein
MLGVRMNTLIWIDADFAGGREEKSALRHEPLRK